MRRKFNTQKYKNGPETHSFYDEEKGVNLYRQPCDGGYSNPTIRYYMDHTSGELKARNLEPHEN